MTNLLRPPKFQEDLADFVADLRSGVFPSKLDAARYFHLTRSTASRYESGQLKPPVGYLAKLAQLNVEQQQREGQLVEGYRQSLLQELNKVLRWYYRDKQPFQKPFQDWEEVNRVGLSYLNERLTVLTKAPQSDTPGSEPVKPREDWGEAVAANRFYGREAELAELQSWLTEDRCQLVAVMGLGGIGKSSLTIKLVEKVKSGFDFLFWRSLGNAPSAEEIVADCIKFVSGQQSTTLPDKLSNLISILIEHLRQTRCLVVLDNFEAVLQTGQPGSEYRPGFEGYRELLQRLGETNHQSSLVITTREKPAELGLLECENSPARCFKLSGLPQYAGHKILQERNLFGSTEDFTGLNELYSGNPLALKLVSGTISELFGGNIATFLQEGQLVIGNIGRVLDQQFTRLSELEQAIMYWVAIGREPLTLAGLHADFIPPIPKKELMAGLQSLLGRSMLERTATGHAGTVAFTQQPVVMEYITERLVTETSRQLCSGAGELLTRLALTKAQDKYYVRNAQLRLIIEPVLAKLGQAFASSEALEKHLIQLLAGLRSKSRLEQGYAPGNIINLLRQLKGDLSGYDFSNLNIWQADLQKINMYKTNLAGSDLSNSLFTENFDGIYCLDLSPDGQVLAAGSTNGQVRLWRMGDGSSLLSLDVHRGEVHAVAFSPDGNLLASGGSDKILKLWEISSGHCYASVMAHDDWIWSIAFSPDGRWLASSSSDHTVRLWEIPTGANGTAQDQALRLHKIFEGHANTVRGVSFSPDNRLLATGSGDHTVKIWEISTGRCLKTFEGHTAWVHKVVFSPDGKLLASAGEDRSIFLWKVAAEGQTYLKKLTGHEEWIWSVVFSPDGRLLASGSGDRSVKIWEVTGGQCLKTLTGHSSAVKSVSFSPDGTNLISGSNDRSVKIWEVASGRCLKSLEGYSNPVKALAISPDGNRLATSSDGGRTLQLWDVENPLAPRPLPALIKQSEVIWSLAFSTDNKTLASGDDVGVIKLWPQPTTATSPAQATFCDRNIQGHTSWIQSIAVCPHSNILASAGGDRTIKLWDMNAGTASASCLRTLQGHAGWIWSVAFSPDGRYLASAGGMDNTIRLWEVATGKCCRIIEDPGRCILSLRFSPDGRKLASGNENGSVRLWDLEEASPAPFKDVQLDMHHVWSLDFSADGQRLAIGGESPTIWLWDINETQPGLSLNGHTGTIRAARFSAQPNILVSGSEDGTIRLWDISTQKCLSVLQSARPYEDLNITGLTGLNPAQKANLISLGAIEA